MEYRVTLFIDERQDFYRLSKVYTGMTELARRGKIEFAFRPTKWQGDDNFAFATLLCHSVKSNQSLLIAFDFSDHSNLFQPRALQESDVYFKRDYYAPDLESLREEERSKVLSFGLNFGCTTASSKRRVLCALCAQCARVACCSPRRFARNMPGCLRSVRMYLHMPTDTDFELSPDVALDPVIVFQTRAWAPEEVTNNEEVVNEQRVSVVRGLRKAFGNRFVGGLVPTKFAKTHYPDAVTDRPTRRKAYIRTSKHALIGVYTRGLHHSLAFKLPEYLAASKCIVSEPLRNALPYPLVASRNYLEFQTVDECVTLCDRLLSDPKEAREMRHQNHDYYRQHVRPAEHMLNCLERAFAHISD